MREKLKFVQLLYDDLHKNFKSYIEHNEIYKKEIEKFNKGERSYFPYDDNYMNNDYGKTALKRKITFLRRELLNLERMLDK